MMHNPLPKTICFISYAALTIGVDVNRDLLSHNLNPSNHPLKMNLLVVDIENVVHRRSRLELFFLVSDAPVDRTRHTCRHCACSISSGTPSTVQRQDSTW